MTMNRPHSRLKNQNWSFAVIRVFVIFFAAFLLLLSFRFGAVYFSSQSAQQNVEHWFTAGRIYSDSEVLSTLADLQHADEVLRDDAQIKIALAKLYILLAQNNNAEFYLEIAHTILQQVQQLQPTHFEADSLMVLVAVKQQASPQRVENYLRDALTSGGLEQKSQLILGPVVVARWQQLPEALQQLAGPMIKSMLSEEDVREVLFTAMHKAKLYRPFAKFSPNRKTSALLKQLQEELQ
ncbi:hypothetical protein [Alteromonas ponticola]|uniref:Tetratricopeptide repeat protein n=1 Tax=Alteromonas ponticola TaxID=2720613 RepID=A0ABX1R204_9ALTE|nr:hypothetical protein [Alteromonas ponticola]NMH60480.1 hypothetical protein [Alteromonas ponticola]